MCIYLQIGLVKQRPIWKFGLDNWTPLTKPPHLSTIYAMPKNSYKSIKSHHANYYNNYHCTTHNSSLHSDKQTYETHNPNDQVNEITGQMQISKSTKTEPEDTKEPPTLKILIPIFNSSSLRMTITSWQNVWGQIKQHEICYKFPVPINRNNTISLFDTGDLFHVCLRHALINYNSNQYECRQSEWCWQKQYQSNWNDHVYSWIS